jgi:K+-sensing histidine kinase KdpD
VVNADNSHIPGTGLGLYVARQLARMHGGDIDIHSRQQVGTTVVVTLPITVDDPPVGTAEPRQAGAGRPGTTPWQIGSSEGHG